jgi:hypothetical protein
MIWIKIPKFILLIVLFINSPAIASDVRLAGMGGGSLAGSDFESDVYSNTAHLGDLTSISCAAGFGVRLVDYTKTIKFLYMSIDTTYESVYNESYSFRAYNPSLGVMFPVKTIGTNFALSIGSDRGDNIYGTNNNYQTNIRVARKLGNISLGIGYDLLIVSDKRYSDASVGFISGENDSKVILNASLQGIEEATINLNLNVQYKKEIAKKVGLGLTGGLIRDRLLDWNVYEIGAGVLFKSILFIKTDLFCDILNQGHFQEDGAFRVNGWTRYGFEKYITQWWAIRGGISNYKPDASLFNYSTTYDLRHYYSVGATLSAANTLRFEYAYVTEASQDRQNHYTKVIWDL